MDKNSLNKSPCQLGAKPILVFMAGCSGSGKTTVLTKLLPELKQLGLRVGLIKHACHVDLPMGKDTTILADKGANPVTIVSDERLVFVTTPEKKLSLEEIAQNLYANAPVDLIIAEGFKNSTQTKVEILRKAVNQGLYSPTNQLLCVVTDFPQAVPEGVKVLGFEDIKALAETVYTWCLKQTKG